MRLVAPVTRGFFSLGASRLVDAASPRTISIDKKKISFGTKVIFRFKAVYAYKAIFSGNSEDRVMNVCFCI